MTHIFRKLPPVGNKIIARPDENYAGFLDEVFSPLSWQLFDSGTSALAAAILMAKASRSCANPQVLMPAYACPDLVSAAEYAGVEIVLVDFERDRPWMDLERVSSQMSQNTVAIVAVNFLGIPERIQELKEIAGNAGALVIDDSAQAFPLPPDRGFWQADISVLSFGRGKPVSILGGGALLHRKDKVTTTAESVEIGSASSDTDSRYSKTKIAIYNLLVQPRLFWITDWVPFLGLGDTVFKPLKKIGSLSRDKACLLPENIRIYQSWPHRDVQRVVEEIIHDIAVKNSHVIDLPRVSGISRSTRLLRYPILYPEEKRSEVLEALNRQGLGGSRLYARILPEIVGVSDFVDRKAAYPNARKFAVQLLTIPLHEWTKVDDLARLRTSFV